MSLNLQPGEPVPVADAGRGILSVGGFPGILADEKMQRDPQHAAFRAAREGEIAPPGLVGKTVIEFVVFSRPVNNSH
ncbi:MAG: hypothetical protein NZR01_08830 [Bryobacteraceae bacterium]|nr:hypothetical protein [Bryobacteraceae bacterium]